MSAAHPATLRASLAEARLERDEARQEMAISERRREAALQQLTLMAGRNAALTAEAAALRVDKLELEAEVHHMKRRIEDVQSEVRAANGGGGRPSRGVRIAPAHRPRPLGWTQLDELRRTLEVTTVAMRPRDIEIARLRRSVAEHERRAQALETQLMAASEADARLRSALLSREHARWQEHVVHDPAPNMTVDDPVIHEILDVCERVGRWRGEPPLLIAVPSAALEGRSSDARAHSAVARTCTEPET